MVTAKHGLGPRRGWLWLVVLLVVLGSVETVVALSISHWLLPTMGAVVVDAILLNWTLLAMVVFASPLWGTAEVRHDSLVVRFGAVGSLRAPIAAILEAAPYHPPARAPLQLGAGFDEDTGQMSLVRSTTASSVIIRFRIPVAGRVQLYKPVFATSLVLTTSAPSLLVDDINELVIRAGARP